MLRIHPETVCLLDRAAPLIALRTSILKRTGTMRPLASPFGSFGRPGFLFLGKLSFAPVKIHQNDKCGEVNLAIFAPSSVITVLHKYTVIKSSCVTLMPHYQWETVKKEESYEGYYNDKGYQRCS